MPYSYDSHDLDWFFERACQHKIFTPEEENQVFAEFFEAKEKFKNMMLMSLAGVRAIFYLIDAYLRKSGKEKLKKEVSYYDVFYSSRAGHESEGEEKQEILKIIIQGAKFIAPRLASLSRFQDGAVARNKQQQQRIDKVLTACRSKLLAMPITLEVYVREYWKKVSLVASDREKQVADDFFRLVDVIVVHNYKSVIGVVDPKSRRPFGIIALLDDIQAGYLGLIRALGTYDGSVKFYTYAYYWICQKITIQRKKMGMTVSVPVDFLTDDIVNSSKTDHELVEYLCHKGCKYAVAVVKAIRSCQSLDYYFDNNNENEFSMHDVVEDLRSERINKCMSKIYQADLRAIIMKCLDVFCSKFPGKRGHNKEMLIYYYGLDGSGKKTLEATKQKFELSRQRIDQIRIRFEKWANQFGHHYGLSDELFFDSF